MAGEGMPTCPGRQFGDFRMPACPGRQIGDFGMPACPGLGHPVARYSATFVFLWYKSQFCEIKFATERTDRELLGRPVARYSAVFLFCVVKVGDRPRGWSDPVSRFLILRNMPFSATEIFDFLLPYFLLPGGVCPPEEEA